MKQIFKLVKTVLLRKFISIKNLRNNNSQKQMFVNYTEEINGQTLYWIAENNSGIRFKQ